MPKFLTEKEFDSLTNRSTMLTNIVAAVLATNPELTEEDITAEFIIQAITSNNDATDPDLQSNFDTLREQYDALEAERDELQEQVNNLLGSAAEDPAGISSGSEAGAKSPTLLDYANKHKDDTAAIIKAAQEDGFLPKQ
ncbi:MAG: hypothetical protein LBS20_10925 [Prevotella sp.]|jgi:hypothetical protein|nr:hypothetical protein [Prevotella sp.]